MLFNLKTIVISALFSATLAQAYASYEPYYEREFTDSDELISRADAIDGLALLSTRDLIIEVKDRLSKRDLDYEDQLERRVSGPPYDTVEKCRDILDRNAHIEVLENLVYTLETCRKLIQQQTGVLPPVNWTVRPRTPSPPPPAAGKAAKAGGRSPSEIHHYAGDNKERMRVSLLGKALTLSDRGPEFAVIPDSHPTQDAGRSRSSRFPAGLAKRLGGCVEGGYKRVKVGHVLSDGEYTFVRKLGWNHYSVRQRIYKSDPPSRAQYPKIRAAIHEDSGRRDHSFCEGLGFITRVPMHLLVGGLLYIDSHCEGFGVDTSLRIQGVFQGQRVTYLLKPPYIPRFGLRRRYIQSSRLRPGFGDQDVHLCSYGGDQRFSDASLRLATILRASQGDDLAERAKNSHFEGDGKRLSEL
ncbi:hypothetical protein DFP72DRAFT_1107790 [Ephemerocybe angulata]|uniref:Uncharacterized protein n=1 Tax=Ephemerocybe angulata TaxID=980116 RepID=A0A8H6LTI5_9AGAR|nr:hypothetical protein DFP72DRAFT_1107790 [Tulosesus angulatus]